jgi:hypothetical protein
MRQIIALFAAASLSVGATQSVEPHERVATELLDVEAPGFAGWRITEKGPARVTFGRLGYGKNGTLIAHAIVFKIEQPRSKEHFVELIRQGAAADSPPSRYRELQSDLHYEDKRGYPCARYTAIYDDLSAKTMSGNVSVLKLQMHSLYCMHPSVRGAAFVAGYSHRGEVLHSGLDTEARQFIERVNVR